MKTLSLWCLASAVCVGCAYTRDVSHEAQYMQWIGKTVAMESNDYKVHAPKFGRCFTSVIDHYGGIALEARIPPNHPVTIEAVKRTRGVYFIGGPYTHDWLILSMNHPGNGDRRIKAWAQLYHVEPWADLCPYRIDSDDSTTPTASDPPRLGDVIPIPADSTSPPILQSTSANRL